MSEHNEPDKPTQVDDASISEPVDETTDSAPEAGLEREDAQQSGPLHADDIEIEGEDEVASSRRGRWGRGELLASTSGYNTTRTAPSQPSFSEPPYGSWFDDVTSRLLALAPGAFDNVMVYRDELTLFIPREKLTDVVKALRDDAALRFELCSSVSGVHYPKQAGAELHVVYHLLSYTHNRRIRLEVMVADADPHVPSVVATYPMANYHERETWDMFGIIFDGHPALTRILMPDDWVGHPQRKDYPLGGIPIEYKGAVVPPPDQRRRFR